MELSREDVLHLADLARIQVEEGEIESLRTQISSILGYVDRLAKVDVSQVEQGMGEVREELAADISVLTDSNTRKALVQGFPDHLGDLLRVPGVFEHPKKS